MSYTMKTIIVFIYVYVENIICSYHIDRARVCVCVCEETHLILFLTFFNDFQRFLPSLRYSTVGFYTRTFIIVYILFLS